MFIDIQKIAGGTPLPEGQVFIGVIGTDPVDTPVSVYSDYACTTAIATPLTLDDNGLPIDSSGNQVNLYVNFDFSIQLQDKYGADFYQNYVDIQVTAAADNVDLELAARPQKAVDETITGQWSFSIPVGNYQYLSTDDPTLVAPTYVLGVSNQSTLGLGINYKFDYRVIDYASATGYYSSYNVLTGEAQASLSANGSSISAVNDGVITKASLGADTLKITGCTYANLAAINAAIVTPETGMIVDVTGQGAAKYDGANWVLWADNTTLVT